MDDPMVRSRLGRTNGTRPFGALDPKQEPLSFCRIHFHVSTLPVQFGPGMYILVSPVENRTLV
jgi:hypothetical protein